MEQVLELDSLATEAYNYDPKLVAGRAIKAPPKGAFPAEHLGRKVIQEWIGQIDWSGFNEQVMSAMNRGRDVEQRAAQQALGAAMDLIKRGYGDKPPGHLIPAMREMYFLQQPHLKQVVELAKVASKASNYAELLGPQGQPVPLGKVPMFRQSKLVIQEWLKQIDWEAFDQEARTEWMRGRSGGGVLSSFEAITAAVGLFRSAYGDKPPEELRDVWQRLQGWETSPFEAGGGRLSPDDVRRDHPRWRNVSDVLKRIQSEKPDVRAALLAVLSADNIDDIREFQHVDRVAALLQELAPFYTPEQPLRQLTEALSGMSADQLRKTGFASDLPLLQAITVRPRVGHSLSPQIFHCWVAAYRTLTGLKNREGHVPASALTTDMRDIIFSNAVFALEAQHRAGRNIAEDDAVMQSTLTTKMQTPTAQLQADTARGGEVFNLATRRPRLDTDIVPAGSPAVGQPMTFAGPELRYPMDMDAAVKVLSSWVADDQWLPAVEVLATHAVASKTPEELVTPAAQAGMTFMGGRYSAMRSGDLRSTLTQEVRDGRLQSITVEYRFPVTYVRYVPDTLRVEEELRTVEAVLRLQVRHMGGQFVLTRLGEQTVTVRGAPLPAQSPASPAGAASAPLSPSSPLSPLSPSEAPLPREERKDT
jgi:hypothetical protein